MSVCASVKSSVYIVENATFNSITCGIQGSLTRLFQQNAHVIFLHFSFEKRKIGNTTSVYAAEIELNGPLSLVQIRVHKFS